MFSDKVLQERVIFGADNNDLDSPVLVPVHLELGEALNHALELRVHLAVNANHFLLILRLWSCRRRHVVCSSYPPANERGRFGTSGWLCGYLPSILCDVPNSVLPTEQ